MDNNLRQGDANSSNAFQDGRRRRLIRRLLRQAGIQAGQLLVRGLQAVPHLDFDQRHQSQRQGQEMGQAAVLIIPMHIQRAEAERGAGRILPFPAAGHSGWLPRLPPASPRSSWYCHQRTRVSHSKKHRHLREPLEAIVRRHPEYGYRRTTVELREAHGHLINRKMVQRLPRMWDLSLIRGTLPPKPSGIRRAIAAAGDWINLLTGKEMFRPFEVTYADFTELVYANGRRKAQLIPIVDHVTKLVLGWAVGERAVTELALAAWDHARQGLQDHGVRPEAVIVHHD